jgi:phosphatidylserine/phosphatidylglycerophosphate/cardiolipin synthase-like enzyme
MEYARAFGNNDVALLAWSVGEIPGCLGFTIVRHEGAGPGEPLPAWVGFEGEARGGWQPKTTDEWPVQKYSWRDLTARPGASYTYDIIPMVGQPGALTRKLDRTLTTNEVHLTPQRSEHVQAFFNRGILSTQHLAHALPQGPGGGPDGGTLLWHVKRRHDPIRLSLAGQIIEGVTQLVARAKQDGGRCFGALYELSDAELIDAIDDQAHVSLVLANAGRTGTTDETNHEARERLHAHGVQVTDRFMTSGHIGHNKFMVYVDANGLAQAVLTGSTNWTSLGLCGQSNNALILEDQALAAAYLDYWERLRAESHPPRATQTKEFRAENAMGRELAVDGASVHLRLSPNTQRLTKPKDPERPVDLAEVFDLIAGAQQGILFLLFQPGTPSVLDAILDAETANPKLFVRGAATDPKAIDHYVVELFHRTGERAYVAAASAIDDEFGAWQRELLKAPDAHAIVHDKILVIDPLDPARCVVVTGSHNLGYQASYANDENLLIVKGHQALAEAYAVHVMDVYDHYRWRYQLERNGPSAFDGLSTKDTWQGKYRREPVKDEVVFWGEGAA